MDHSDKTKLEELFLYIAGKTYEAQHPGLGRIRVAKLLFLADFGAYFRFGKPITGATYWADELGPAPSDELIVTRDLEARGDLEWETGYDKQGIPVPLRPAKTALFTSQELEYVDSLIERYKSFTSKQLVDIAHEFPGWVFAWKHGGPQTVIPFNAAFWSKRQKLSAEEQAHAAHLADEFGLAVG
ncbi:MAG TPA: Panacea domain-containing protein [Solirubrobacteraceae bacterium]|jgi:hypothetical protein|nr:Panacea domain-containing protein [Solirubrobacteraceae bacterium]